MVYLPTFAIKINHSWIGKYTSPMDPVGTEQVSLPKKSSIHKKTSRFFLQIDLDGSGSLTRQEFFKATKQRS